MPTYIALPELSVNFLALASPVQEMSDVCTKHASSLCVACACKGHAAVARSVSISDNSKRSYLMEYSWIVAKGI